MNVVCIVCPIGCTLTVEQIDSKISVRGNNCKKGVEFAINELTNPMRSVTTTVATALHGFKVLPVRTSKDVPKDKVNEVCKCCGLIMLKASVSCGDVIINNVANTGADIIATRTVK